MTDEMGITIDLMERMYGVMQQLTDTTHHLNTDTRGMTQITDELRDHLADFDDFWRPIRGYFYWDKHCFDIPVCSSFRSLFDSLDGIDRLDEKLHDLAREVDRVDSLMPQMLALLPPMIDTMKTTRDLTLTTYSTFAAMVNQMGAMDDTGIAMGQSFDASKNDDFFYLPPEAFGNPEFIRGLKLFLSPDGKAARFFVTQQGDPATPEGISRIDMERTAAQEGLKQSSLSDAKVYIGGEAATDKDLHEGERYDLMIAILSALTLIFMIMLLLTRSLIAALVIVGTAASSIAAAFGLSALIWQHIVGLRVYWVTEALAVIILLAVGSDYNLLLVSRFKEEIHAGLKTGIIRSMAGTGGVVTAAGIVFAFTMASMIGSDMKAIGQLGLTICLGLLLDTLIVRTLFMPSVATLLGRWFWWPQVVHPRGTDNVRQPDAQRLRSLAEPMT
jgi:RND superfamily putative drug exporter